jgi:hypothetical protein
MQNHRLIEFIFAASFAAVLAGAAQAYSCAAKIDKVQAQVDARIDAIAGRGPEGVETRAARLHHQPTPASIAAAERRLHDNEGTTRALAALVRARKAHAAGQESACEQALAAARAAIAH